MATLHERVIALERGAIQHDKQIKAIRDLVQVGMRLMVETRKEMAELRKELRVLAKSVQMLTNSLQRGSNGHAKRKLDLQ
jgi:lysyl-tRNA synthetase class II